MTSAAPATNEEVARGWIAYQAAYRARHPPGQPIDRSDWDDTDFWPVMELFDIQDSDPLRALEIVFLIAKLSDDNGVLSNLGAGPLEDLLDGHPEFLETIGRQVEANANLHLSLCNVWRRDMSDETWAEVQRLVNLE